MSMDDYCNVYCSNDPYLDAGAPSSEVEIISGRVSVHGIVAYASSTMSEMSGLNTLVPLVATNCLQNHLYHC